ncbi:PAS domain-containing protein [Massilia sp. LC238]|uniref:PAS domain-containing protein n=1 Tax=Massilia sp. LC238 TaxID=1502852 RepID=UPI0009E03989|nr:PAS domain-containing protein [Massilia sp. LC238]
MAETVAPSATKIFSELLFECSVDCVKVIDLEGRLVRMNRNGQSIMEIVDFDDVQGATWIDFWPEEARALVRAEMEKAYQGGTGHFSAFCPTAAGTPKYWDVHITPIRSKGRLEGLLSVSRDITAHQQTIDALNRTLADFTLVKHERERSAVFALGQQRAMELAVTDAPIEKVLSTLTETAETYLGQTIYASILLSDDEGRCLRVGAAPSLPSSFNEAIDGLTIGPSAGACGTAAYTKSPVFIREIQTDPLCAPFVGLADAHGLRSCWSQPILSSKGRVLGTFAFYCRESRSPTKDETDSMGVLLHTASLLLERHHEAKERKATEKALKESEAKFRTIANAMPQMVWSTLPDGYHDYYNDQWYEFTGVQYGSTNGDGWNDMFHPDDQERAWKRWRHSLATGEPYEIEYRLRHHSGVYRWTLGRALPQRDENGEIVRWMGTCTDIHEQRLAQEALQDSDRRKDEFLAMLAHELRNPLAPISAAAELLQIAGPNEENIQRISDVISRQARHMTGLIEDLLDVSRVTQGKISLEVKTLDVRQVVEEAVEQIRPLSDAQGHHLIVDMPPAGLQISGDKKRLVQVLANLLSNAVKYTHNGGNIALESRVREGEVILTVRDNGIGMSADLTERAFELFVQGERTSDRQQGGLGIGLALVKSLVTLHGGRVTAHSAGKGLGSEFSVSLPVVKEKKTPDTSIETNSSTKIDGDLQILLVDDNVDAAEILGMLLKASGYNVYIENHPQKALICAETVSIDVCILDIGLPDMNGIELANRLRHLPNTNSAVLIALTGYGQPQDREATQAAGFAHHFVKPGNINKILALLADILKKKQALKESGFNL